MSDARLRPRRSGEGVMQRVKIAIQPDKGTGVGSYCKYINGEVRRYIPFIPHIPDSITGESSGRQYFIPKLVLSFRESGRSQYCSYCEPQHCLGKLPSGTNSALHIQASSIQEWQFALTCGRIRKRSIADSACLSSPTALEQISQETESEWDLEQ